MVLSKRNLEVNLVVSDVANVVFFCLEAEPSRLDRTRMADNHVEQNDAILLARHTISRALVYFVTMLTYWTDDVHAFKMSKEYAFSHDKLDPKSGDSIDPTCCKVGT